MGLGISVLSVFYFCPHAPGISAEAKQSCVSLSLSSKPHQSGINSYWIHIVALEKRCNHSLMTTVAIVARLLFTPDPSLVWKLWVVTMPRTQSALVAICCFSHYSTWRPLPALIQRSDAKLSELRRVIRALQCCMLNERTNTTSKWLHQYLSADLRVLIDKSGADYWHGSLHCPLECDSWSSSTDVLPSLLSLQVLYYVERWGSKLSAWCPKFWTNCFIYAFLVSHSFLWKKIGSSWDVGIKIARIRACGWNINPMSLDSKLGRLSFRFCCSVLG